MERYRIHEGASVYFVTYSVVEWLPVFTSETTCSIITDSLTYCHTNLSLRINAYVIMPTHLHAIVFDSDYDSVRLAETLTAFRKHTGRSLADYASKHLPNCFTEAFRKAAKTDRARRFWQPSRHPVGINSRDYWEQKLNYLHDNPERKGLVLYAEDWRFSSARYYISGNDNNSNVMISDIDW